MSQPCPTALLIRCPEAEHAVGAQRARLDLAARVGVPAHVTVVYPFKPADRLTETDQATLKRLFANVPQFSITGADTSWFDDSVVFVRLLDPTPVIALTDAVVDAFPDHPPYEGVFGEVIPHLTIGHGRPAEALRTAEQGVRTRLPFTQHVYAIELWSGPPLASGLGPWRSLERYPLG